MFLKRNTWLSIETMAHLYSVFYLPYQTSDQNWANSKTKQPKPNKNKKPLKAYTDKFSIAVHIYVIRRLYTPVHVSVSITNVLIKALTRQEGREWRVSAETVCSPLPGQGR